MADATFKLVKVPRHAGAMAERAAVLRVLVPGPPLTKDADVAAAVLQGVERWRRRVNVLRKAGWEQAQGVRFQYLRNCPPAGAVMRPDTATGYTRPCQAATVCPWCWARQVVKRTWDVVTAAMERHDALWAADRTEYPYKLILTTRSGRVEDSSPQPVALLDQVHGSLSRTKRAWAKVAVGAAFLGAVHPGKDGWVFSVRAVGLVPAAYEPPPDSRVKVVTHPTRRKVAQAVARFARYPAGMVFGDPERAVRLLAARGGYRLYRTAGAFNGRTPPRDPGALGSTRFLDL